MQLKDKIAFVTGGASGLGKAIATRFVAEGASVIIADIDKEGGEALVSELGQAVSFVELDVSNEESWQNALESYDRIDILINNAGITTHGSIEDVTLEMFRHEFNIDVVGVFLGSKYIIPKMKNHGGSIVNMSSLCGIRAQGDLLAYNAAKAAVTHMTKSCALHFAEKQYNIRANSIHPGVIHTPILDKVMAQVEDGQAMYDGWVAGHPIGRLGKPEEVAALALYLSGDESGFTTGGAFSIDGGASL